MFQGIQSFRDANPSYNGITCNCSYFAKKGVIYAAPPRSPLANYRERIGSKQAVTPNYLYKTTSTLSNAVPSNNQGTKVQKNFLEAVSGEGGGQKKADKIVEK